MDLYCHSPLCLSRSQGDRVKHFGPVKTESHVSLTNLSKNILK